jgi:hypothetical protein
MSITRIFNESDEEKKFRCSIPEIVKRNNDKKEQDEKFKRWFRTLLLSATMTKGDIGDHPLGSCLYRDIIRDKEAKNAMRRAWHEIKPEN